jgi:hypothetical protein
MQLIVIKMQAPLNNGYAQEMTCPACSRILNTYLGARSLMEHFFPSEEINKHVSVIILHNK